MKVNYEGLKGGKHIYEFELTADEDSDLGYAAYYNGDLVEDFLKNCVAKKIERRLGSIWKKPRK